MVKIINLSKSYPGGKLAVNNISLEVAPGEIFGFIGHNGAGKTTTIKCMVGILDFQKGDIFINGKSIKKEPIACKYEIAYIPDNPDIYEQLTGIQYLNFICDVYKISKTQRNEDIKKYAKMFEIDHNLGDVIASYSHGMKQKLVLLSALIRRPKLYVMDEPFVGLDPKMSYLVKETMKEKCQEGASVFFSTHVLEVAEKLCHRIAIIKMGEIVTIGKMEDVKGKKTLEDVFLELFDHA
ncbi:MAG: ABC transporter ATP-binding protein [Bacilli bacterium]|nr:ABC transporter ATP-binding protein [Bacilli bacterium]MDD4077027.1 ABC transporter ATP-binding protein [Bacilli bacterium]